MTKPKNIPSFRSEAEERRFWEARDSTAYVDWDAAERVRLPNLKPSTKAISIRLPVSLLQQIKVAANRRDIPYQSLMKVWLFEKAREESRLTGRERGSGKPSSATARTAPRARRRAQARPS